MSDPIDTKQKYVTIKEAAQSVSYSRDYITRLAREGKIAATLLERQWHVDPTSLATYAKTMEQEAQIRKQRLSEERKLERKIRQSLDAKESQYAKAVTSGSEVAVGISSLVLLAGMFAGLGVLSLNLDALQNGYAVQTQVASVAGADLLDVDTLAAPIGVDFNRMETRSKFGVSQAGLFLLPEGHSTSVDPTKYFSDDVRVSVDEDNNTYLVKLDARGNAVGAVIPYIEVPVDTRDVNSAYGTQ